MTTLFLPLFDWNWGIIGAAFMFAVFLALVIVLLVFLRGGKKKNTDT